MNATSAAKTVNGKPISISKLNHVAVPVRDPMEAVRFWTALTGAQMLGEYEEGTFAIMLMPGGFLLGCSKQPEGWTGRTAEYPHIGLEVEGDMMEPLKQRLEELGVPCEQIWTRFKKEGLMYFRDPSGNLFELICEEGYPKANTAPVGHFYGGTFKTDLEALNYSTWNDPGKQAS